MELQPWPVYVFNSVIVYAIILAVGAIAVANPKRIPGRLQNFIEYVIELVSEITKPFSLGMRLFGNVYAEDYLNNLAGKGGEPFFLPTQFPVYFLQLFTDIVQAVIFSLLTCAYISLMIPHHDEDHGGSNMATKPG